MQDNFSLWPWSLALGCFVFIAMWEMKAGTNHFCLFEADVYNFVCILEMYCNTF